MTLSGHILTLEEEAKIIGRFASLAVSRTNSSKLSLSLNASAINVPGDRLFGEYLRASSGKTRATGAHDSFKLARWW
jgi:hypothetical protein